MYYLSITDATPTLFLNKSFDGLPELFSEDPRPRGERLTVAETVSASIAKSAWLAMFQTALHGIRVNENDEYDWPEISWQKDVLEQILPHIYLDLSNEAAEKKQGRQ